MDVLLFNSSLLLLYHGWSSNREELWSSNPTSLNMAMICNMEGHCEGTSSKLLLLAL
ncbi:hypothetical protein GOP47_0030932, partial [Adiantum capillus-veneris]